MSNEVGFPLRDDAFYLTVNLLIKDINRKLKEGEVALIYSAIFSVARVLCYPELASRGTLSQIANAVSKSTIKYMVTSEDVQSEEVRHNIGKTRDELNHHLMDAVSGKREIKDNIIHIMTVGVTSFIMLSTNLPLETSSSPNSNNLHLLYEYSTNIAADMADLANAASDQCEEFSIDKLLLNYALDIADLSDKHARKFA